MSKIDLPDFEDMFNLVEEISDLTRRKISLDATIKISEAEIVKKATTDSTYFISGKVPSMDLIKNSWMTTGFNNELIEYRMEFANVVALLEKAKLKFQIYQDLIDLYRTQAANERASVVS